MFLERWRFAAAGESEKRKSIEDLGRAVKEKGS
jgi:hypothetical protein